MAEISVRLPQSTMKAFKARTDEVWKLIRKKKGQEDVYLVPKVLLQQLKEELGPEAFIQRPKPVATPKQKLNYAMLSMDRQGVPPAGRGEWILSLAEEFGLSEDELTEIQRGFIKEFRNEQKEVAIGKKKGEDIGRRGEQEVQNEEEYTAKVDDDLDKWMEFFEDPEKAIREEKKVETDLIGRPVLKGGAAGEQQEFLDKEDFKTLQERERIVSEKDKPEQNGMESGGRCLSFEGTDFCKI